jgi:hypothetical protein
MMVHMKRRTNYIVIVGTFLIALAVWRVWDLREMLFRNRDVSRSLISYSQEYYNAHGQFPTSIDDLNRWCLVVYGSQFGEEIRNPPYGGWYMLDLRDHIVRQPYLVFYPSRGKYVHVFSIYEGRIRSTGWHRKTAFADAIIIIERDEVLEEEDTMNSPLYRSNIEMNSSAKLMKRGRSLVSPSKIHENGIVSDGKR